jgi:hypothetical protein
MLRAWAVAAAFALLAMPFAALAQSVQMPDFQKLERELRLKPHQKAQYDIAVTSLKRSLIASASTLNELRQQLADELGKSQPDFMTLLSRQRAAYELNAPIYRETLDEWGKLYALLEDDQVLIAKRFLKEALEGAMNGVRVLAK